MTIVFGLKWVFCSWKGVNHQALMEFQQHYFKKDVDNYVRRYINLLIVT
jgi:hypothetical protein